MNALKRALSDKRLDELHAHIKDKVNIRYSKVSGSTWSSNMEGQNALIEYSDCSHPSSSLAHELLHLDTQLSGYRRLRIAFSNVGEPQSQNTLLTALDNELQHHKFYNKYLSLGFDAKYFYSDDDADTEQYLRETCKLSYNSLLDLVPQYLTAIAPGGSIPADTQSEIRESFLSVNDELYRESLIKIEGHISEWKQSKSFDVRDVVRKIMLDIQPDDNLTWIGFDQNSRMPESGFYIGREFVFVEK